MAESIVSTAKLAYHGRESLVSPCGSLCAACWDAAENDIAAILKGNGTAHYPCSLFLGVVFPIFEVENEVVNHLLFKGCLSK